MMNEKAKALGLEGTTHFANTTGLYDDNHYTTCRDMAAIMNCAMNNPVAKEILMSYKGKSFTVYTNNQKLKETRAVYANWYSGEGRFKDSPEITDTMSVIAGKTGWEDIPKACFVTFAEDTSTDKKYICVTVGRISGGQPLEESQSTADTRTIYKNYT